MVGIVASGAYIPRYRLGKETAGWGSSSEKAVANFDEDSVTMAVAAGRHCLEGTDPESVDAILFATTTPPYAEKQCAAIVATALDLKREIFAADVTGVLRAGTTAMKMAMDSINAGSAKRVLVVASDTRIGSPRGDMERNLGDGAAALLLGQDDGAVATIEATYTVTENMLDIWRSQGDSFVRSWEERFTNEEGLERILPEAVDGFMAKHKLAPSDFAKVALYSPDARRHSQLGRRMGFSQEQLQDPLFGKVGNTGAAHPLLLLVSALEESGNGDLILTASYGDGSDVLSVRMNSDGGGSKDGSRVKSQVDSKALLASYETYARWRDVWTSDAARRPAPAVPSVTALWRESDQNIRLHGAKCTQCGSIQYPPQRVCTYCLAKDESQPVRLLDKRASVFTYSMDYLAGTTDTPLVITVINFEGGGRMLCMMTDRELDEVRVGMDVDMSFRKLRVVNGIHNYYWKSVPVRG